MRQPVTWQSSLETTSQLAPLQNIHLVHTHALGGNVREKCAALFPLLPQRQVEFHHRIFPRCHCSCPPLIYTCTDPHPSVTTVVWTLTSQQAGSLSQKAGGVLMCLSKPRALARSTRTHTYLRTC